MITWLVISLIIIAGSILLINLWINIYNKLQYWYTRAQRHFADVAVVLQQRFDTIQALTQIAEKYKVHEFQTLTSVIEARSRWSPQINENIKQATDMEYNYGKIHALLEKYPEIRASEHYKLLMNTDTELENRLRQSRVSFNYDAQRYNEVTRVFPNNIIATTHNFKELYYLIVPRKAYDPTKIFQTT